jgi:hypothetical protein
MKKIFIIIVLMNYTLGIAQYSVSEISKDGYLKDFDIAIDIIQKQHPNPYRFNDQETFKKKVDSLQKEIEKKPTFINFYANIPNKILGDGHVTFIPDSNYHESFLNSSSLFPLATYIHNGNVFVNGENKYNIEIGSQLLEINNYSVNYILKKGDKKADGNIKVENINFGLIASFRCSNDTGLYTIKYKTLKGEQKVAKLSGITYSKFYYEDNHSILPMDLISTAYGVYGYRVNSDTYYLSIKSFNYDESTFYERLSKYFQEIRSIKSKNLVIDIRDNDGGSLSNIPLLYSFITKHPQINTSYKYGTKVIDILYQDYLIDLQTNRYFSDKDIIDQNNFMRQRFEKDDKADYYFGNARLDDTYIKNYPRDNLFFDGKVVLIINNGTFSAAAYFASLFSREKRGDLVGKETGSCSNFTTAAWFINYKLPNTKSILSIPRSEIFFNENATMASDCRGVFPTHTIETKYFIKALTEKKDPELEYSLSLLK